MKTRVTVTLEDNNMMSMEVEGEAIAQLVIGMLRFGQLCAEQDATLHILLNHIDSNPVIEKLLEKLIQKSTAPLATEAQ